MHAKTNALKHSPYFMLSLVAAFLASGTGRAAEKQLQPVDLYGEALPQGAIARMGTIQFRHPPAGFEKTFLSEPTIPAAFSPDGCIIATSFEKRLRLWNAKTGKLSLEIQTADWFSGVMAFSPDGRFIAAILSHDTPQKRETYVRVWDIKTGKTRHRFPAEQGQEAYTRQVLFSSDGKMLALTDEPQEKGAIHVWSMETGKEAAVRSSKSAKITAYACLAFMPDGKTLVAMPYQSSKLWHWDVAKGEVDKLVPLEGIFDMGDPPRLFNAGIPNMYDWQLSKDAKTLACRYSGDGVVRLVDTATGKTLRRFHELGRGTILDFTGEGRLLATAECKDRPEYKIIVSLSETKTGKLKHQFKIPRQSGHMAFSPDGSRMIFGGSKVRLYDLASGNELLRRPAHKGSVSALVYTPDSGTLLSGGADGMIGIWDTATGKSRHFVPARSVTGIALVPGGCTFVSCGQDGLIRLHDWRTGKEIHCFGFTGDDKPQFKELRVSADGKTLISQVYTGNDSKKAPFHTWDLASGELLRSFPKQGEAEFSDLTGDGERFLGVKFRTPRHLSYTVELRDTAGGRLLFTTEGIHSGSGLVKLMIAKGRLMVQGTSQENPTLRLLELASGKERLRIVTNKGGPNCDFATMTLSPDGRTLAAAKNNNSLQLWDLFTAKELMQRSRYDEPVNTMAFSPNGKFLATGHSDGTILVWDVLRLKENPVHLARSAKQLDAWWKDLAGEDAAKAHIAVGNLVAVPQQTVALFKDRLRPASDKSVQIAKLIAQLDNDTFTAREAASNELKMYACQAVPTMRRTLKQRISLEERLRLELILDRPGLRVHSPELLQGIRAIEVLEYIATGGAHATRLAATDLLKKLADGAAEAPLTQEAKAALRRLARTNLTE